MTRLPAVSVTVQPSECDAFGHVNEGTFLQFFERARWEAFAGGPDVEFFRGQGIWPAVRRVTIDYRAPASSGDTLSIETHLLKLGHTSLELQQRALRPDGTVAAETQLVLVMVDSSGKTRAVPQEMVTFFGARLSTRTGQILRYDVGEVTLAADVRGDGPALLLLHGFPLDRSIWTHQVATLSGWRRIAPDLRGLGASDAPPDGYSMAAYADDIVRLLERLRVEKAVVAGLSMGGYVAFEMMRRHADKVAGLILCDTKPQADTEDGKRARDEMAAAAESDGARAVADRMLPKLLGRTTQQTQPQVVEQVREMIGRSAVSGIIGALRAMRDREDSTELLGSIGVPTLVVVGNEDELTPPPVARKMMEAIPSASITLIPGAGHVTPLEAPIAVSRVFAEFLEAVR